MQHVVAATSCRVPKQQLVAAVAPKNSEVSRCCILDTLHTRTAPPEQAAESQTPTNGDCDAAVLCNAELQVVLEGGIRRHHLRSQQGASWISQAGKTVQSAISRCLQLFKRSALRPAMLSRCAGGPAHCTANSAGGRTMVALAVVTATSFPVASYT